MPRDGLSSACTVRPSAMVAAPKLFWLLDGSFAVAADDQRAYAGNAVGAAATAGRGIFAAA